MRNMICLCILSALLAACASQTKDVSASVSYDAERQARIRLFGQNGRHSTMNVGKDCATGAKGYRVNVGGGVGDAFKSLARVISSKTLGIPETEATRRLSSRDRILSKAFYQEFVIPAGTVVQVRAAFIGLPQPGFITVSGAQSGYVSVGVQRRSSSRIEFFVPEAGKDYEAISTQQNGQEFVWIYEVTADGALRPLPDERIESCWSTR